MSDQRTDDVNRFYSLLSELEKKLGGARTLFHSTESMDWPERGVYFFREPGENRSDADQSQRIVRVGTHALKARASTTLWNRLSGHKGDTSTGGGNHRGSVFRLIVGQALCARDKEDFPSWGEGTAVAPEIRRKELPLEQRVSATIGAMPFLWLEIDDAPGRTSLRNYVNRNAIALLSNYGKKRIDPPSTTWLGNFSDKDHVRYSGLWNTDHVTETYDPAFLAVLERLISEMPAST